MMIDALSVFAALADPTRLRVLLLLREMELSVGELASVLAQSQPRVSRHLKILADAGLVERHKEGAWVFVRLGSPALVSPVIAALASWGADDASADLDRLERVRNERAAAAQAYFAEHAGEWDGIRSLHVADEEVEAAILRALGCRPVGELLDIGTGTGRMIELLGASAATALGIDRSPEMLRIARGKLEAAGLTQARVRQADMYALPLADGAVDTVILHQVLHYAQEPARAVAEAARVLSGGGHMLVVDFAPHDREALRAEHAHAQLGFEDEQVAGWMRAAGLRTRPPEHLTGGDLTVTLWIGERAPLAQAEAA
jgi:ArsR family transcriptional regulator